ncbi:MAG: transglutaminase domain-containing protein, partial [Abitibacteriaceae bacterium]|nr:transglutaminase domain-containing protein [Abditibacteriaceae bacterium]
THDEEVLRSILPRTSPVLNFNPRSYPSGASFMHLYGPSGRSEPPIYYGYDVARRGLAAGAGAGKTPITHNFGAPRMLVRQTVMARSLSFGYVPMLPEARLLRLLYYSGDVSSPERIFIRKDNSAEVGVLDRGGVAQIISEVPPGGEYTGLRGSPPLYRQQHPNPRAALSPQERQLYLALPSTLPPGCRVRRLALRETHKADADASDYARAQRLELYVRGVGTYTLHPPEIPAGQDATDYFLFKSQRGYCTYYAGALTVLCRAAGIPARVVSGFVNPEWDTSGTIGTIYESSAHAWTEVWVPNWGWATLDATPTDDRGNNAPNWWDTWTDVLTGLLAADRKWLQQNHLALALGSLCLISIGVVLVGRRQGLGGPTLRWLLPNHAHLSDDATRRIVFNTYGRAAKVMTRRFRPRAHWETPVEWLQAAETELELRDPTPLRQLTNLYAQAKYSPQPLPSEAGAVAQTALTNLSWQRNVKPE